MKNKLFYLLSLLFFALLSTTTYAQEKLVKGKINDEAGFPIPGASLLIKGTTKGSTTDIDGNYTISAKPGDILVFTYLGYKTIEQKVTESNSYNVSLTPERSELNEVVVVGYGTQKKSDVTGALTRVSAEELNNRPVSNAMEALQGKAAGVDITTNERPGQLGTVRIRGQRSLTANSDPLYVVDGVPLFSSSAIETLNPRDIESIDVLKDASATAIYGSRGANGVIIVTTKQGKAGQFTLNYTGTLTTTDIVDRSPSMSATDFIQFKRWAAYNGNSDDPNRYKFAHPNSPTLESDTNLFRGTNDSGTTLNNVLKGWESGTYDPSKVTNTDWTKFVTQTGITNEHVISASGGSEKFNTYGSFGYLSNSGTQKGQTYDRYTAKLTSNITPVDWFKMNASLNVSWSEQEFGTSTLGARSGSGSNAIYGLAKSIFNIGVPYDDNGNLVILPGGEGAYTVIDEWEKSMQNSQTFRTLGNFSATFDIGKITQPLKGLSYKINFGPDFRHQREGVYIDGSSLHKINSDGSLGRSFARLKNNRDFSWTLDNMITYDRTFANKHKVGATLLQSASSWNIENSSMSANNIPKASFRWDNMGGVDINDPNNGVSIGSDIIKRQLSSYMARFTYGFDNRYLLTMSGRWDGASQLADGNKWDFFPSAAIAWRIEQEEFMKEFEWVDNFKFRLGFGTTGNSAVEPYGTRGAIQNIFLPFNGQSNQIGYTTNEPYYTNNQLALANPSLGWEKTTQYNLGIDFGILNNRISGNIDIYKSFTTDLLMAVKIPTILGSPETLANIGKTNNKGVEVTLNLIPIQNENGFTWETSINGAWQKDEIEELAYGKNDMVDNSWFIGQSINVHYGWDNLGLWQDTAEDHAEMDKWLAVAAADANLPKNDPTLYKFTPGTVRPKDQNGDYRMTQDDRVILGNKNPRWTMGWNNIFTYKGFELSMNIYGRMGYTASLGGEALTARANQREVDYWTPDNPNAEFQKPQLGEATSGSLDRYSGLLGFKKASFVKIRNISLGYKFPQEFSSSIGLANLKLYAQAVNPGSIYQSVDWYDFDTNATYFNRSFVMGIEIGF